MINIPLSDIKEKIAKEKGISEQEINTKIKAKLDQLSGLISEEGAAHIIANELGVELMPSGIVKISEVVERKIICRRIGAMPVPIPAVKSLETEVLPSEKLILSEIKKTIKWKFYKK